MEKKGLILFDGVCNLCNTAVQFVIRYDKKKLFQFAPLQSKKGQLVLKQFGLNEKDFTSFVLIKNNTAYLRSSAALEVSRWLALPWPLLYGFIIVPKFIRDAVYKYISRNRYRWFGKKDSCMVPTPELKSRFHD